VLAFYILNDFHRIYAKGILLVPPHHRPFAQELVAEISALFGKYLRGLAFLCVSLGLAIAATLYLLKNPYWQLFGLMGGLLYAVPVVGSLFTICLVMLVTLAVGESPMKALLSGGAILLLSSGLFDQLVTPRVLGRQVGLHPILTILALMVGNQVAGITGMLVAVPLAASVQTVIVHLVPKLRTDMELKPLEELQKTEAETRAEHLRAEESAALDDHRCLTAVVEHVEAEEDALEPDEPLEPEDAPLRMAA
jgi:predicted PurR-regulated permease PerM